MSTLGALTASSSAYSESSMSSSLLSSSLGPRAVPLVIPGSPVPLPVPLSVLSEENAGDDKKSMDLSTRTIADITNIPSEKNCCDCDCLKTAAKIALVTLGVIGLVSGIALGLTVNSHCFLICLSFLLAFTPGLFPRNDVQQVVLFPQAGTDTQQVTFSQEDRDGLERKWEEMQADYIRNVALLDNVLLANKQSELARVPTVQNLMPEGLPRAAYFYLSQPPGRNIGAHYDVPKLKAEVLKIYENLKDLQKVFSEHNLLSHSLPTLPAWAMVESPMVKPSMVESPIL